MQQNQKRYVRIRQINGHEKTGPKKLKKDLIPLRLKDWLREEEKSKIMANGNKKITAVHIDSEWLKQAESEEVEDLIAIACNRAIENAEKLSESEMRGMLPGFRLGHNFEFEYKV